MERETVTEIFPVSRLITVIEELSAQVAALPRSREASLVATKLDEARLWAQELLRLESL